ncbi:hypothetical protein JCM10207_009055 [Rhodosporidiobolus poonsookiae]
MLPFGPRATFRLTATTPSPVTYGEGISPKHTLNVHDLDGEGKEWTIEGSCSKVSIYNSKNLTLHLAGRIVTSTVELFNCSDLNLVIGPSPPPSNALDIAPLGVLQLDPTLSGVSVTYTHPQAVGKVVVAPAPAGESFGFSSLSLQAGESEPFLLFDAEGRLRTSSVEEKTVSSSSRPADLPQQLVLSHGSDGWSAEGLKRNEKDYPSLS